MINPARSLVFVAVATVLTFPLIAVRAAETKKPAASPTSKPATQSATIEASDATAIQAAVGKPAVVLGTIDKAAWSRSGKVMRISFKGADASHFEAVVFSRNKEALDKKFKDDAEANLSGAKVRVTGTITNYAPQNNPDDKHSQIIVNDVKQIELVDPDKK